jgi:cysteine desulfurase
VRVTLPLPSLHPTLTDGVERFCAELPDVIATVRAHLGTDRL